MKKSSLGVVYKLFHIYNNDPESEKYIGLFSTKENAEDVILKLWTQVGFKDYPKECFILEEIPVDKCFFEDGY